jgi:hypothetical protein
VQQVANAEIAREADAHIALGILLRKDRPEPKRSAVQKVLSSSLSTAQKVEKIRQVDEQQDAISVLHVVRQASAQAARGQISRFSRLVKQPIQGCSYLTFLFREYGRVRQFGRRTHALDATLWPPGIRLDPNLPSFLVTQVQAWATELSPRLKVVTDQGWVHLTPRQYNHVVLLRRLSDRIQAFDFVHLNLRSRSLVDSLGRIETLFLMLHYHADTISILLGALRHFSEKRHEPEEEIVRTHGLVVRLLRDDITLPSLYNCLLAFNIFQRRRLLTMSDLTHAGLGEVVDTRGFDCEPAVRERMESYIDESIESIKRQHGQLQEARRLGSYIVLDDDGQPDTTILHSLYKLSSARAASDFDADQQNVVLFVSLLLRAFDTAFAPLLNGKCTLAGIGRVPIFARAFFGVEFTRLRSLIEKLETGPFHFGSFPLQQYFRIRGERLAAIGSEVDICQIVDEAVGCLVDLGKTLTRVLSLRSPAPPSGTPPEPIESLVLQGKAFSVPFEYQLVQAPSFLRGKSVLQAIAAAVTVCFTAGLLFRDDFLFLYHGKETKLADELRRKMELMENLLDPESYQEFSALFVWP